MVLSVPQGMQTEFGLQPFQDQSTSLRSPIRRPTANRFFPLESGRDDIYRSSRTIVPRATSGGR